MELKQDDTAKAIVPVLACVLQQLCVRNDSLPVSKSNVTKFHAFRPPAIGLKEYLSRISKYASCSGECFVLALVYIDRIIQTNPTFVVNSLNIHRLLITSVMLAAKYFDDHYFNNAYYAKVGGVPCGEINSLEVEFLFMTNFTLFVSTETYAQYYRELSNHAENAPCGCSVTPVPPLVIPFINPPTREHTSMEGDTEAIPQVISDDDDDEEKLKLSAPASAAVLRDADGDEEMMGAAGSSLELEDQQEEEEEEDEQEEEEEDEEGEMRSSIRSVIPVVARAHIPTKAGQMAEPAPAAAAFHPQSQSQPQSQQQQQQQLQLKTTQAQAHEAKAHPISQPLHHHSQWTQQQQQQISYGFAPVTVPVSVTTNPSLWPAAAVTVTAAGPYVSMGMGMGMGMGQWPSLPDYHHTSSSSSSSSAAAVASLHGFAPAAVYTTHHHHHHHHAHPLPAQYLQQQQQRFGSHAYVPVGVPALPISSGGGGPGTAVAMVSGSPPVDVR